MADSRSYRTPQFSPKEARLNKPKSNFSSQASQFLCKSIVVLVFVIAIPLFPSQTPEIFNNTLLNKFWELFHLLFIGLAVCYGLFSRRSSDLDFETTHLIDDSQSSFVSRIFHVSPIFEDGSEIQFGSAEKNGYLNWDSQIRSRCTFNGGSDEIEGVPGLESVSEVLEEDENNVVQAWSSQYFHGESESVVVVSEPKFGSEPRNVGGFRPLGLPVRSLSSRVQNSDSSYQFSNRSLSDSSLTGSSTCPPGMEAEEVKFGDQSPVFLPSDNSWGSRSVRPELRERVVPVSNRSHFRNSDTSHQFSSGNLSGPSLMGSSNCSPKSMEEEEENFGDRGVMNSDKKLNENVFLPSQNPRVSRPGRPELRERVLPVSNGSLLRNSDSAHQFSNGSVSVSSLTGSPKSMEEEEENFGDQGSVNADPKLNENGFLPSQNPWGSRPGKPELRERVVGPLSSRSCVRNSDDSHRFSNGSVSDSSLMGSSNCSPKSMEEVEEKFGYPDPVNPDEKPYLPSQNPLISGPGRSELRERVVPPSKRSHLRPHSVDETQFESFKSQSFRSSASLSPQTSSVSTSPDLLSPSHSSSSDSPKSGTEKPVKLEGKEATLSTLATESPKRDTPLNAFHLRRYSSSGSLFQKNSQKRAKDDSKNPSHKRREEEQQPGSSKPDKKCTNSKTSSRGKSVRTIRSGGAYTPEAKEDGDTSKLHIDDNIDKRQDADLTKMKYVDSNYKVPKPTFAEYQTREKKKVTMESEHKSEPEIDDVLVRLANKVPPPSASDSGHDPNEVDKKASEFIAKFREQIRLQKVASMERSKVIRMSGKYLR